MQEMDSHQEFKIISKEFAYNVVTYSIHLEEVMTTIICLELAKEWIKTNNFLDYVEKMSFDNKINLAEIIIKSNHPKILEKFPKIFGEIRTIKDLRNSFAHKHRIFLASTNGSEPKFMLFNRKQNNKTEFTKSEILKQTKRIEKCREDLWELQDLFAKDFGYKGIV